MGKKQTALCYRAANISSELWLDFSHLAWLQLSQSILTMQLWLNATDDNIMSKQNRGCSGDVTRRECLAVHQVLSCTHICKHRATYKSVILSHSLFGMPSLLRHFAQVGAWCASVYKQPCSWHCANFETPLTCRRWCLLRLRYTKCH